MQVGWKFDWRILLVNGYLEKSFIAGYKNYTSSIDTNLSTLIFLCTEETIVFLWLSWVYWVSKKFCDGETSENIMFKYRKYIHYVNYTPIEIIISFCEWNHFFNMFFSF